MSTPAPTLQQRQHTWMQALLQPQVTPLPQAELGCWSGGVRPPEHALAVYINNVRANVLAALRLSYPLMLAVAGRTSFHRAALQGLASHPPHSGDLGSYGAWLPALLAPQADAGLQAAWLTLAELEWQLDQWRATPPGPAWAWADAAQALTQDHGPQLRPTLRLPARLWTLPQGAWALLCAHPGELQAQWLGACEPGQPHPGTPPPDTAPTHLLQQGQRLLALDPAAHAWLAALQAGHDLQTATEAALASHPAHLTAPSPADNPLQALLPTLLTHELLGPPGLATPQPNPTHRTP